MRITRRTALRGLGTLLSLPWLESSSLAGPDRGRSAPIRMAIVYVPNGIHMPDWTPQQTGSGYEMPWTLRPLEPFRKDLLVLSGLTAHRADGPSGNHARASAVFLTGRRPPDDGSVHLGISFDQIIAEKIGRETRLPSLQIGGEPGAQAGKCDSPYSCAYTSNLSWKSESTPLPPLIDPRAVFDRLFEGNAKNENDRARAQRAHERKSILDFVTEDAAMLRAQVSGNDRRKLDEYLSAVREVETRLDVAEKHTGAVPTHLRPKGAPLDYKEHLRLLSDLMVLAFQSDVTRIVTFAFANEFSNRPYPFLEVRDGHHDLSHHENDPAKQAKLRTINRFHVEQFAYLLEKLKEVKEREVTLLDNCIIAYGCGNSDGNRHNHDNLPILLAGRGGATIKPGRHVQYKDGAPLTNLWLSLMDGMGTPIESLGDSTGRLKFDV